MEGLRAYLTRRGLDPDLVIPRDSDREPSFSMLATPYYLDLMDWSDPSDPLRRMVVPDAREREVQPYERADPIGDRLHEPVPGIVHRYPDRCLLMLTHACAIHCRFCFRRNLLGGHQADDEAALHYIREHVGLREVIFSGGDPFMLPIGKLDAAIRALAGMTHVRVVRFHTRVPTVDPARVSAPLLQALAHAPRRVVVLHVNHPREITREFREAVGRLRSIPAMLLSQSVLLRGVNDRVEVLEALFRGLTEAGIAPYYLHHLDPAAGTHHFRVSLEEGRALYTGLRARLPGYAVPEYVVDLPGAGKVPVMTFKDAALENPSKGGMENTRLHPRVGWNPACPSKDGMD